MIMRRLARTVVIVAALAVMGGSSAWAGDAADCHIFEIKASKGKAEVDPALEPLRKKLSKPPFDSWTSFKLMAKHDQQVERMKALELKLAPGGKLSLLYRDLISAPGKKPRLRLSFTLDDKSGKRVADLTVKLDSGDYNLIGGGSLPEGAAYILATTCSVK